MIKRLICLTALAAIAVSCRSARTIPDDKLVAITREIYLANALRGSTFYPLSQSDSVDMYTPIFEKYGYKPSDLSYTIRNLSRRKSVRFTDIIDRVTEQLAREDSLLGVRVALLDTVDARIDARYREIVLADTAVRVLTRPSDVDKPEISLPVRAGRYEIEFVYDRDTSDRNNILQYAHFVVDTAGEKSSFLYRSYLKNTRKRDTVEAVLPERLPGGHVPQTLDLCLAAVSGRSGKRKDEKEKPKTSVRIDSLRIAYYLPREEAYARFAEETMPGSLLDSLKKDTTHVRIPEKIVRPCDSDTAGLAARGGALVR